MSRFARKVDTTDPAITATLRRLGLAVRDLSRQGGGCPDKLVAAADGRMWVVEMKSKGVAHGQRLHLSPSQRKWATGWPTEIVVLRSVEDAAAWALNVRMAAEPPRMPEKAPGSPNAGQPTRIQPCGQAGDENRFSWRVGRQKGSASMARDGNPA